MTKNELKKLKSRAHALKPVVIIGNKGLTDAVLAEIDIALNHHELIKLKMAGADKISRQTLSEQIGEKMQAVIVQRIGQMAVFYRQKPDT